MSFNPFEERGVPLEKQILSWSNMKVSPYDPESVHPYTRARGILMNGIETDAVLFYHHFHRHIDNMDLRRTLAQIRRIEQQEQKMVNWAIPASETTLEVTIGYEQLAVDLTAALARTEKNPYVKSALEFGLIEDFDHLYRYADLMALSDPKRAEAIVGEYTEVMPGRPTVLEHLHPIDTVRQYVDRTTADVLTRSHILTIIAAEQQTMNYYMNVGNRIDDDRGRALYQEIAMIEEQHVTHYGSLDDPRATWFEMAANREYNECYMYYSCMVSETDERMKKVWRQCLDNELTHLHTIRELMKKHERKDPIELFPREFPAPTVLEPAKSYIRNVIDGQIHLTGSESVFVPLSTSPGKDRYLQFQDMVNGGDLIPSQTVVMDVIAKDGRDYRVVSEGAHPVDLQRDRSTVPSRDELTREMMSRGK